MTSKWSIVYAYICPHIRRSQVAINFQMLQRVRTREHAPGRNAFHPQQDPRNDKEVYVLIVGLYRYFCTETGFVAMLWAWLQRGTFEKEEKKKKNA